MDLPQGPFKVQVWLYTARNICQMEFPSARFISNDRRDLLPPDALGRVARIIIEDLHDVVWPEFMPVTNEGEVHWADDWADHVRMSRTDIARNFTLTGADTVKAALSAVKSRYQKRWTLDVSSSGGWTLTNDTDGSGRDRFYDKDAELLLKGNHVPDGRLISQGTLFRFESQVQRSRLKPLGVSRLSDISSESAWAALEARWQACCWGVPLPSQGALAEAVKTLPGKQQMELIGYLFMAEVGADIRLTDYQRRRMSELADTCGLTPGVPVVMLGEPRTRLDLHAGRIVNLHAGHQVAAAMSA